MPMLMRRVKGTLNIHSFIFWCSRFHQPTGAVGEYRGPFAPTQRVRMLLEAYLEEVAATAIRSALELEGSVMPLLRPTADAQFGDFQINAAMPLAKKLGRPPRELAGPIAEALQREPAIEKAEVAGPGFVNLTLRPAWVGEQLEAMLRDVDKLGVPLVESPETIVVDFSSPNIAKQMHVGHLRTTVIGDSVSRLLGAVGHRVIRDNHIGDWGTQFGLLIVGMREFGDAEELERDAIAELERVYKLASARAKEDEAFAEQARAELARLQAGDADNRALWEQFVTATRASLDRVYALLGVEFDEWLGESAYHDALPEVVERLLSAGIAREDQGALCVFFGELSAAPKGLRKQKEPFIVRKKDGAFLYSTTDIATVLHREQQFRADRSVYVVDARQSLHFRQLFAVMGLLEVNMRLDHVAFGTVLGDDGKPLRTRDGQPITLFSLLTEAEERAGARIDEARESGKLRIADEDLAFAKRAIGIGSVKYADLHQNRMSDYRFDWDKMISFAGNAAPYLMFNYARTRSIFDKASASLGASEEFATFAAPVVPEHATEIALARTLIRFPDVVHRAAETYQPHLLCEHLYSVATAFSRFFTECPVLKAEGATRSSRLGLTALVGRQLERGLGLLGIPVITRM